MNSLSRDCQQMKENYDNCFNKWFKEEFLKGNDDDSACAELFKSYQECLKKAVAEQKIDVWKVDKSSTLFEEDRKHFKP